MSTALQIPQSSNIYIFFIYIVYQYSKYITEYSENRSSISDNKYLQCSSSGNVLHITLFVSRKWFCHSLLYVISRLNLVGM